MKRVLWKIKTTRKNKAKELGERDGEHGGHQAPQIVSVVRGVA